MKASFIPPSFVKFRLGVIHLWIPIFLLWPIYLLILLLTYVIACFWALYRLRLAPFRFVNLVHIILCNTKGMSFEIQKGKAIFFFKLV